MSAAWIHALNTGAALWMGSMERASWEGVAALALAWVVCRLGPRLPPRIRCWLWRLAYLKLVVALLGPAPLDLPLLPAPPAASVPAPASPGRVFARSPQSTLFQAVGHRGASEPPAARRPPAAPATRPDPVCGLLLLWLLGVGGCGLAVAREWREMRDRCALGVTIHDAHLMDRYERLCRRVGVRRRPRLLLADGAGCPLLIGVRHPVILLPASLNVDCSLAELEMILAHELAHQKRRDLLWSWLPAVIRALLFFHPLVWLAGHEWRLAQEMACDEMAVAVTTGSAADYGDLLLRVATWPSRRRSVVAVGVMESYRTLKRRLMAMKTIGRVPGRTQVAMGVALLAIGALGLLPWRVTAQTAGTAANEKGSTEKLNHESQMRLKQLGAVLLMYAQDYDEVLPPMESPSAVKKVIYPYVRRSDAALLDPHTNEPYQPNPSVSRCQVVGTVRIYDSVHNRWTTYLFKRGRHAKFMRVRGYITALAQTVAFYEPAPAADGTRGVVFLDGHVARVPEAQWPQLRKNSGIP